MPTLIKYSGDDDLRPGGPLFSDVKDSNRLRSLAPSLDVYCSPRKRSRITGPFVFRDESVEQKKMPSIDVLPDECLFEIFRRVSGGQEKSACACVSKRWLMVLSSIRRGEICGKSIVNPAGGDGSVKDSSGDEEMDFEIDGCLTRCLEGKKATDTRLAAIAVGIPSRGGLGELLIRGSNTIRGVTDLGISAIARGCPALKVLSLWNLSSICNEGLSEIAKGCHQLEKLDLRHCSMISDKGIVAIAENCPNLTTLTIESCSNIGNATLQAIGQHCPNLQSVCIKDCSLVGDQGVSSLVSSASGLTKIKLHGINVTDVSLAVIGFYGKGVTKLSLTGLHNVTERGFWALGNALGLLKLKEFMIESCSGVTDLGLVAIGRGCPNLKLLGIRKCSFFSDGGLEAFSRVAASLESLQLEECNRITQVGVFAALSNCCMKLKALSLVKCVGFRDSAMDSTLLSPCSSLRSLSIRHCPGFGNPGLAMVGELCPQLQQIDLSGLYRITDLGILALLERCASMLLKVNLSGCINLTDVVVSALANLHGKCLQLLNLNGCRKITDDSLKAISANCLSLQDLDLSTCYITDFGLATLSSTEGLDLQILSLSGCSQISDKSLPFLAKLGESLVGLNLQDCGAISSKAVGLLEEELWRCDILS